MSSRFSGSGPGPQTRDGCSIELYRQLPYLDELEGCRAWFEPGMHVLELGCGAGRLTRRLLEWDLQVTAVDNSAEMLSLVPTSATKILSDIEALGLDAIFDVVVLASGLINHPDRAAREAFVRIARRHLRVGGRFLLQRQNPEWLRTVSPGPAGMFGAAAIVVEAVDRDVTPMTMTLRYEIGADIWRQSFSVVPLSDAEVEMLLASSGFDDFTWLGSTRRWLSCCRCVSNVETTSLR
jgi:SAM-dependent methyltransferase